MKNRKRTLGEVEIPAKRVDALQLRALSQALRSPDGVAPSMRIVFADALDRYLVGYPLRVKNRPRKDERNFWLAVGYWILWLRPKTKRSNKKGFSGVMSDIYTKKLSITLGLTTIGKLPARHPEAESEARRLIQEWKELPSGRFADHYEAAFDQACWFVQIVEAAEQD